MCRSAVCASLRDDSREPQLIKTVCVVRVMFWPPQCRRLTHAPDAASPRAPELAPPALDPGGPAGADCAGGPAGGPGCEFRLQWQERSVAVNQVRGSIWADRLAPAVRVLEASPTAQRALALAALQGGGVRDGHCRPGFLRLCHAALCRACSVRDWAGRSTSAPTAWVVVRVLVKRVLVWPTGWTCSSWMASGSVSAWRPSWTPKHRPCPTSLLTELLITLGLVMAVVVLAVQQATRPLRQLAQAADTLGSDLDAPPLPEDGPTETRHAAQAFNRAQARIKHLTNERARALAAVSHDLRTPLTRLRLRTELIDDERLREQMSKDLEAMATMIDGTLAYLRGLAGQ